MKKIVSVFLSVIIIFSLISSVIVFAAEDKEEKKFSVTLYEDSSKCKVLYKKHNQKAGNRFVITFEIYKEGHSFVSWIDADTGEEINFYNNIVTVPEKDAEYYIRWQVDSYNLIYRNDGAEFARFKVPYSTPAYEIPVPEKSPDKDGYDFKGWSALPATMPASDMVVVSLWDDTCSQANFYVNIGDGIPYASIPFENGNKIIPPDRIPNRKGYLFKGWSLDGKTVVNNFGVMEDVDVSVYAVWSPNKYTATFDANGGKFSDGSAKKTFRVDYGSKIDFKEEPAANGLIFNGWTPNVDVMNNINGINFRANWIDKSSTYYTVRTYVMDTDGKYSSFDKIYRAEKGEIVNAPYTVDDGFELNRPKSFLTGAVKADSSLVLKVYLDRKLCDFYVNVDGQKTRTTYLYGEKIGYVVDIEKEGYVFLGWEPAIPETMPSTDYTVTAIWEKADEPHSHTEKTVKIEPTCTEDGKIHVICEECGESIGEKTLIPAKGHLSGEWLVVLEPTYEAEGRKVKKCLECGLILEEAVVEKLEKTDNLSDCVLKIKDNTGVAEIDYSENLDFYIEVSQMPDECVIEWSVSGEGIEIIQSDSAFCRIESVSSGVSMLTATLVDSEGEALRNSRGEKISDSVTVISNAGLWQRIVAFFKRIFIWK